MRARFSVLLACAALLPACSSSMDADGGPDAAMMPDGSSMPDVPTTPDGGPDTSLPDTSLPDMPLPDMPLPDLGPAVCGDGVLTPPEMCDDGNTTNGDGCSSTCTIEAGVCPGGKTPTPLAPGVTISGDTSTGGRATAATGSCGGGSAPEDVYTITVYQQSDVNVTTDLAGTMFDTAVYVRSACGDRTSEVGCRSAGPMGDTLALSGVMPGTYFVFVDGVAGRSGAYQLDVTVTPRIPDGGACDPTGAGGLCMDGSMCVGGICTSMMAACSTSATELVPGTTATGDTTGGMDVYGPACSSDGTSPERMFHVHVAPGMHDLVLTATPTNFATDMFDIVLDVDTTCGDPTTSVGCSDSPNAMDPETVTIPNASGDYYVLVDGYGRMGMMHEGMFSLTATLVDVVGVGGTCDPTGATSRCDTGLVCMGGTCVDPTVAACMGATAVTSGSPVMATLAGGGTSALAPGCAMDVGTPENVYSVTVPAGGGFLRAHATGLGGGGAVYVRGPSSCNPADELACTPAPGFGGGATDATTGALAAGTYDVIVDGTGTYTLTVTVGTIVASGGTCDPASTTSICAAGTYCIGTTCAPVTTIVDVTPNALFCDAQGPVTGDTVFDGILNGGGVTDLDNIRVDLATAGVITFSTSDGAGGCVTDTYLELFDSMGMTCGALDAAMPAPTPIAMDDDSGIAPFCSLITTGTLAAGTYYIRVRRPPVGAGPAGPYVLLIDMP